MQTTKLTVLQQGNAKISGDGYLVVGNDDCVCFFFDPVGRAYIEASSESDIGCPVVYIVENDDDYMATIVEFSDYPGWRFHAGGGGKSIAIALVNRSKEG